VKLRISLIVAGCVAVAAVVGAGSATAATAKSYCIDNATVSVSNATLTGMVQQFQLDAFANAGGAYTMEAFGGSPDVPLLDGLSSLGRITSAFPLTGGVFHPVLAGECAAPVVTPTPTPTDTPAATPDSTAASASSTSAPQGEESIYLCYSKFQVDPGSWSLSQATQLVAGGGYWKPSAVFGGASSTKAGLFNLVCNPGGATAASTDITPTLGVQSGGDLTAVPSMLSQIDVYPFVP
jgi:hypothetical protein